MSEKITKRIEERTNIMSSHYLAQSFKEGAKFGYQLAQEEHPNQDELWEEFWRNCVESDWRGQEYFNYEEAKKRYRITRVK